jgi:hypothetical protein
MRRRPAAGSFRFEFTGAWPEWSVCVAVRFFSRVLSGVPLPCRGSNQTAARSVTVSYEKSRDVSVPAVTTGNQMPSPVSAARDRAPPKPHTIRLAHPQPESGNTLTAAPGPEFLRYASTLRPRQ